MTLWSLGLRSEKYIITSQHEDLVHLVLFLLDTELPGYGCWLAVDDLANSGLYFRASYAQTAWTQRGCTG